MSPARGRAALLLAALVTAGVLAGCGSSSSGAQVSTTTSAARSTVAASSSADAKSTTPTTTRVPSSAPAPRSPGAVALGYTAALFRGHFARARADVAPESRNALKVVALGLRSTSVQARHLRVGTTTVRGDEASVVLTGTLCSSHTDARSTKSDDEDCISNHDRHSTNPIFGVALHRGTSGAWQVIYRMPG